MAASQLGLYNAALGRHLGERTLASLTENREPRRALDAVYSEVLDECLEAGYWKHARRTVQLVASNSMTPQFGYNYAFDVPADCLQFYIISVAPDMKPPLNDWVFENGILRTRFDTIYMTYISSDPSYGLSLSKWAPSFGRWVAAELASAVAFRLTQSKETAEIVKRDAQKLRRAALSRDAMDGPNPERVTGTWVQSRRRLNQDTWRGG